MFTPIQMKKEDTQTPKQAVEEFKDTEEPFVLDSCDNLVLETPINRIPPVNKFLNQGVVQRNDWEDSEAERS